jgi:hypothetical protein
LFGALDRLGASLVRRHALPRFAGAAPSAHVALLFPRSGFYTFTASGAVEIVGIAIRLIVAARPKPKLLPHLSEARTAKFAVKHVE